MVRLPILIQVWDPVAVEGGDEAVRLRVRRGLCGRAGEKEHTKNRNLLDHGAGIHSAGVVLVWVIVHTFLRGIVSFPDLSRLQKQAWVASSYAHADVSHVRTLETDKLQS